MDQQYFRTSDVTQFSIALGSNKPPEGRTSAEIVTAAFAELDKDPLSLVARSALYQSPSFPAGAGPDYVNAAAIVTTRLSPQDMLAHLHDIEAAFGRERQQRWGNRVLDLDLLAADQIVLPDRATFEIWRDLPLSQQMTQAPDQLILPHPRLAERAFVLVPLAEIAPDWRHPVFRQTVRDLRDALPRADVEQVTRL